MMTNYKNRYVSEIIQLLKDTSGRNDKIEILKNALDTNAEFLQAIKYTYDPYMNYYISSLQSIKDIMRIRLVKTGYRSISHGYTVLEALNTKGGASTQDKLNLGKKLEEMSLHDVNVYDLILKRSFDCGVSASSINKARPGTIPTFDVLLCEKMSEKTLANITYPAVAQIKMDGMRALIFVEGHKVSVRSRSGKDVECHGKFDGAITTSLPITAKCVLDGELVVMKKDGSGYENRRTGNGICNKAVRGTITPEDADRLVFIAWDMLSVKSFWEKESLVPYRTRFDSLDMIFGKSNKIHIVKGINVENFYQAEQYYHKQLADGQEGIILKNLDAPYVGKRTKDCIKMKVENSADLQIVAVVEGQGRLKGKLGSFVCQSQDGLVECNVGTGFSDEQRDVYFSDNMIGDIIEIKYNEIIANKADETTKSLFLPVFIEFRTDKTEANTLGELK